MAAFFIFVTRVTPDLFVVVLKPRADFFFRFFFGFAVTLLNFTRQNLRIALGFGQIVIGQIAPFRFRLAF